jgi:hypothetical protein
MSPTPLIPPTISRVTVSAMVLRSSAILASLPLIPLGAEVGVARGNRNAV